MTMASKKWLMSETKRVNASEASSGSAGRATAEEVQMVERLGDLHQPPRLGGVPLLEVEPPLQLVAEPAVVGLDAEDAGQATLCPGKRRRRALASATRRAP